MLLRAYFVRYRSPQDPEHSGKRKAASCPPDQLDREMDVMELYT